MGEKVEKDWIRDTNSNRIGAYYYFFCPACNSNHKFEVRVGHWSFNGNMEKPSFEPSLNLLLHGGRCHLFVKDGRIQYLGDCKHDLAGQSVEMRDMED